MSFETQRSRPFLRTKLLAFASVGVLAALADPLVSVAQAQALEEIVVSARKRDESLMQIPVSITAVSADSIQEKGIKSIEEMARFTPGFFSIFMNAGGGVLKNVILGIVGAVLASLVFGLLGISFGGWIGYLIAGFIGACILIALARAIRR